MEIKKDHLNFAVGPVPMEDGLMALGAEPIPYFRTADFSALMLENERLMKQFVHAEEGARAVFLTGSGTSAMEASVMGLFSKNDRLLIVNGGSFGHRFCEICDVHEIPYEAILLKTGESLTREHLACYEGKDFSGFLVNMGETSTGVLYDMPMIADFCRRNHLSLVVDAISTFLADELDMAALSADVVLTGSQKALAIAPGVAAVVLSPRAVEKIYQSKPVCYYLDLKAALINGERGQTPFTPAVGILIQLNRRLCEIEKEGFDVALAKTRAIAEDFRRRIVKYPFTIATDSPSNAVTPLSPNNPNLSAYRIFEILKEEFDIIICPNGGEFKDKLFRVGHIGHHTIKDNDMLFDALDVLVARGIIS